MLEIDTQKREQERQFIEEGMAIWQQKKAMDVARQLDDQRQLRHMLNTYNPWGKPGNGAPIPGSVRKNKLILDEPDISEKPSSVLTMGRPGHGAPLRTLSGRTKTTLQSDPNIRFQFTENSRRSVDNELRYRNTPEEKENYRRQLEAMIQQKMQQRKGVSSSAIPRTLERSKQRANFPWTWGRPGPGGRAWRDPRLQGFNFLKSLGWSNETTLRRLPQHESEQTFEINGGVELVPLLAKHRGTPRRPLPTTDITRISRIQNGPKTPSISEELQRELSHQVSQRHQKLQEERLAELESSRRHYDTWKGWWGRPGHGAPKGCNLAKEKLEVILYELPARRLSAL